MKSTITALILSALLSLANSIATAQPIAFTNVTVIDVKEGVAKPGMSVIVIEERITAVGSVDEIDVPDGATIIEGTGKYLIPGLWDMHAHIESDRDTRKIVYPLFIAHGVIGIRNMHADCFDCPNSIEQVKARQQAVAAGELIGPRVVASSWYAGSHDQAARRSTEGSSPQAPATEADARAFVRLVNERGVDFIKIYDMLPREAYFALADEANTLGLPFAGHVPVEVRASEASDAGQASIEHPDAFGILIECSSKEEDLRARIITVFDKAEMGARHTSDGSTILPLMLDMVDTHDPGKCAALAEQFVRNGTWIVPTLMMARLPRELGSGWREKRYTRFLSPEARRYFEWEEEVYARDLGNANERVPVSNWLREVTGVMHRAGVPILAGSDAGSSGVFWGISLHDELELLVDAGLTETEALRATTYSPAEFLERTDLLGTVEEGKLADLVLLDANPLEDITHTQQIRAVMANGRYYDRKALDELLQEAERAAREPKSNHE